jgi:hypothetical protein
VLRFEFWAHHHIVGPAARVHSKKEEYFEVLEGHPERALEKKT